MALRKPTAASGAAKAGGPVKDKTFEGFPVLLSYLQDDVYEDGSKRERATLTVFIEDGAVKLALNDRGEHRSCYVTAEGLKAAMGLLEAAVASERADWRAWGNKTKKK